MFNIVSELNVIIMMVYCDYHYHHPKLIVLFPHCVGKI